MNIALIGYGRMGHEIESAAPNRGHFIKLIVDKDNLQDLNERSTRDIDIVVEFTTPETAFENVVKCLKMKIPVVCGTTGWLKDYDKAVVACNENRTSFIHSSNFSIGVNILFRLNTELAEKMAHFNEYKPFIEEIHHTKKDIARIQTLLKEYASPKAGQPRAEISLRLIMDTCPPVPMLP